MVIRGDAAPVHTLSVGGLGVSGAPGGDKDEAYATDAAVKLKGDLE
jgi:uncharacterized protein GlcG (DUF336 family)